MQIQRSALEKVEGSRMSGPAIRTIFERMLIDIDQLGIAASEITLDFQDHTLPAQEGEMVPVIILALRPAISQPITPTTECDKE